MGRRRNARVLGALGLGLALAGAALAQERAFVSLFDGKTLQGWKAESTDRVSVRDGVIFIDGGTGWLRSVKRYKDFELVAEYRALTKGADSGVFFRATAESQAARPHWPARGYQLQVVDAESNLKIFGHGTPPPRSDRKADALRAVMKGPGQWQRIRLKVVGGRAEASLNDQLITVTDAVRIPEGHIGLQGENGPFEWRGVKIRELSTEP